LRIGRWSLGGSWLGFLGRLSASSVERRMARLRTPMGGRYPVSCWQWPTPTARATSVACRAARISATLQNFVVRAGSVHDGRAGAVMLLALISWPGGRPACANGAGWHSRNVQIVSYRYAQPAPSRGHCGAPPVPLWTPEVDWGGALGEPRRGREVCLCIPMTGLMHSVRAGWMQSA
jgi:hypothetical protein